MLLQLCVTFFLLFSTTESLAQSQPIKDWTILVFANGKNNLERPMFQDLNEMERIGSTDKVNIVVEWGAYSTQKVKRYFIQRDSDMNQLRSPVIQDRGSADMGDYREVIDFVRFGVKNFPARRTFLVMSDHGTGWHGIGDMKVISHDDLSGNAIELNQLSLIAHEAKKALGGRNLDVFGADACLMSMAEVAGELYGMVDYVVASQELEPGDGWHYDGFLSFFNHYSQESTDRLLQAIVYTYMNSYLQRTQGRGDEATLSALNLSHMPAVAQGFKAFAAILRTRATPDQKAEVMHALGQTLHFDESDYLDLMDFLNHVSSNTKLKNLYPAEWLQGLRARVGRMIIANGTTPQYSKAHGVSFWGPVHTPVIQRFLSHYQRTRFDRATEWSLTLKDLFLQSRHSTKR